MACGGGSTSTPPPTTFAPFVSTTAATATGSVADSTAEVDLGMRSATDGPSFGNYQPDDPFGADDAIALFGAEAVCESPDGECIVRAKAQAWIDKVANATRGGVCEGMALWSLDRYLARAEPLTATLPLDAEVNDRIVRLFATQFLPQVSDEARANRGLPLADLVTRLGQQLANGTGVTMGIYSDLGGHTLVPYSVDDLGDGRSVVAVYDPNWPGQERYLEVDATANTWRYSFFAADQALDPEAWFGTGKQIDFVTLERREAPFPEAFDGSGSGQVVLTITTTSRNWALTDGDTVLADPTSSPGEGVVDTVIRGAFGTTTVVASVPADGARRLDVVSDQATTLTVETQAGSLRVATATGSGLSVTPDDSPAVAVTTGEAEITATTDTGRVSVTAGEGARVTVAADEVRIRPDAASDEVGVETGGDVRRDFTVDIGTGGETPTVEVVPVPTLPSDVRTAEDEGLIASLQGVETDDSGPSTSTTTPTTSPSSPSTTGSPSPTVTTTTVATTVATTTSRVPNSTSPSATAATTTTTPRQSSTTTTTTTPPTFAPPPTTASVTTTTTIPTFTVPPSSTSTTTSVPATSIPATTTTTTSVPATTTTTEPPSFYYPPPSSYPPPA